MTLSAQLVATGPVENMHGLRKHVLSVTMHDQAQPGQWYSWGPVSFTRLKCLLNLQRNVKVICNTSSKLSTQ